MMPFSPEIRTMIKSYIAVHLIDARVSISAPRFVHGKEFKKKKVAILERSMERSRISPVF